MRGTNTVRGLGKFLAAVFGLTLFFYGAVSLSSALDSLRRSDPGNWIVRLSEYGILGAVGIAVVVMMILLGGIALEWLSRNIRQDALEIRSALRDRKARKAAAGDLSLSQAEAGELSHPED